MAIHMILNNYIHHSLTLLLGGVLLANNVEYNRYGGEIMDMTFFLHQKEQNPTNWSLKQSYNMILMHMPF